MNKFTKDELIELAHCVDVACYSDDENRVDLMVKIQSMIENFCEHESNGYWHQLADCSYRFKRCSKCRKEFDRHKWNNELEKWENE